MTFISRSFALCLGLLATLSLPSQAHTVLEDSNPAANAVLHEAPQQLMLQFADPVNLMKVSVTNQAGKSLPIEFKAQREAAPRFTLPLPALQPDAYRVQWTALGADGHVLQGNFSFELRATNP